MIALGGRFARKRLARRGEVFDEGSGTVRGDRVTGHFHGREAALFETSGGRGTGPGRFHAKLACSSPLNFDIYPHATVTIGKPRNSFETGDAELDKDFGFVSEDPGRFNVWLLKPENKQRLVAFLHWGSHRCGLEMKQGHLRGEVRRWDAHVEEEFLSTQMASAPGRSVPIDKEKLADSERGRIREVLEALTQLAGALESGA